MSEELKPCPFCGGLAVVCKFDFELYAATCVSCGSRGKYASSEPEAVEHWNRRV